MSLLYSICAVSSTLYIHCKLQHLDPKHTFVTCQRSHQQQLSTPMPQHRIQFKPNEQIATEAAPYFVAEQTTPTHCRWIGNAAEDGKMGTVFARLKVPAPDGSGALDDHGVHAFIVPLRDEESQCFPGVEIKDCGYKVQIRLVHAVLVPACMLATTCSTVSTRLP